MKFIVSEIQQNDKNTMVCGITEAGVIKGVWKGREPPVMLNAYHVELSCKEFNVRKSDKTIGEAYAEVLPSEECVHFCGVCEGIDEDVYFVRFAADWLDMVDIPEGCNEVKKGDYVSFEVKYNDIWIYVY